MSQLDKLVDRSIIVDRRTFIRHFCSLVLSFPISLCGCSFLPVYASRYLMHRFRRVLDESFIHKLVRSKYMSRYLFPRLFVFYD